MVTLQTSKPKITTFFIDNSNTVELAISGKLKQRYYGFWGNFLRFLREKK
jgi:hypothetical protein